MYRGLVEPHFSYCCSVWGNCSKRTIDNLQKVQNRAARIVMNSGYDASAAPLIQSLGWPTISNLIHKETATLIYKSLNDLAPGYMRNLFARCSESNGRVLRSTDTDLKLPLLKTSAGQKSFSYRGARLWNSLSREAKVATSLSAFNRLSKNDIDTLNQSHSRFLVFFIKRLYKGFFVCNIISINLLLTCQFGKQYLYYTETFYVFKYYKIK